MRQGTKAVVLAFLILVAVAPLGAAKSLRVVEVDIDADLLRDGRMEVVERITYDFDGSFTSATRAIPPGPYAIGDFRVESDSGRSLEFSGEPHNLSWRFAPATGLTTFRISYTVTDLVRTGSDVAALRWQWLGPAHPGVAELDARLDVPGDPEGLLAWGRGPLSGEVEVDGDSVTWSAAEVPAGIEVLGRVAVPVQTLSVPPGPAPILPGIQAEEEAFAAEAARRRTLVEQPAVDRERLSQVNRWFLLVPLVGWIVFALLWREWGRDPEPPADIGRYVREPPDDPPAILRPLLNQGVVDSAALTATLVDLAQRGALEIVEVGSGPRSDWRIRRGVQPASLLPFEQMLLARLFAEGEQTSGEALAARAREHPAEAARWWAGFCTSVNDELRSRHYIEEGLTFPFLLNVLVAMFILALSITTLTAGAVVGVVGILSSLGQLGATLLLGRRTARGARRVAQWRAFRRFLLDFSNLRQAPLGHVELWERYLVYGVALGLSGEVAKGIAMKLPPDAQAAFAGWFHTSGPGGLTRFGLQAALRFREVDAIAPRPALGGIPPEG